MKAFLDLRNNHSNSKIVITGHSLGAAVSSYFIIDLFE